MSSSPKSQVNISYGGRIIDFFLLAWGVYGYIARVVERERVVESSSSRMMDYNAPPNSSTYDKAQREFELSSGVSNIPDLLMKCPDVWGSIIIHHPTTTLSSTTLYFSCDSHLLPRPTEKFNYLAPIRDIELEFWG